MPLKPPKKPGAPKPKKPVSAPKKNLPEKILGKLKNIKVPEAKIQRALRTLTLREGQKVSFEELENASSHLAAALLIIELESKGLTKKEKDVIAKCMEALKAEKLQNDTPEADLATHFIITTAKLQKEILTQATKTNRGKIIYEH
jgi:hypothetical protein